MNVPQEDWLAVVEASHAVIREAKEAAVEWAVEVARSCRCAQELREFEYDPES